MLINKIEIPTDGVVIGSRTLAEYKFQVLNFMNLILHDCIKPLEHTSKKELANPIGEIRRNMSPWFGNLIFEIERVREQTIDNTKYHRNGEWGEYPLRVDNLKKTILSGDLKQSQKDWLELLRFLGEKLNLDYELK